MVELDLSEIPADWLSRLKLWGISPLAVMDPSHPQYHTSPARECRNDIARMKGAQIHEQRKVERETLRQLRRALQLRLTAERRIPGDPRGRTTDGFPGGAAPQDPRARGVRSAAHDG